MAGKVCKFKCGMCDTLYDVSERTVLTSQPECPKCYHTIRQHLVGRGQGGVELLIDLK